MLRVNAKIDWGLEEWEAGFEEWTDIRYAAMCLWKQRGDRAEKRGAKARGRAGGVGQGTGRGGGNGFAGRHGVAIIGRARLIVQWGSGL